MAVNVPRVTLDCYKRALVNALCIAYQIDPVTPNDEEVDRLIKNAIDELEGLRTAANTPPKEVENK